MSEEDNSPNLYAKLREMRRARGLTVNKLAEKMGENYQKVGRIERGKSNLTIDYLMKISKALNEPLDSIIQDEPEKKEPEKGEDPSLLSEIIMHAEKHFANMESQQKAQLISSIYREALSFPLHHQSPFLSSLFNIVDLVIQS